MARKDADPGRRELATLRRQQALALRIGGARYAEIARTLGVSVAIAHGDVQREIAEARGLHYNEREQLRAIELERLDALLVGVWDLAKAGNLPYVDRVIRIMERRARLLGLDTQPMINVEAATAIQIVFVTEGQPNRVLEMSPAPRTSLQEPPSNGTIEGIAIEHTPINAGPSA